MSSISNSSHESMRSIINRNDGDKICEFKSRKLIYEYLLFMSFFLTNHSPIHIHTHFFVRHGIFNNFRMNFFSISSSFYQHYYVYQSFLSFASELLPRVSSASALSSINFLWIDHLFHCHQRFCWRFFIFSIRNCWLLSVFIEI